MMAGPGSESSGGGPARHIPVLLDAVIAALGPTQGARFVDGTFGAGGYTTALLRAGAEVIAIDRDPEAIAGGEALQAEWGPRLRLVHGRFSELDRIAGEAVDGVVLDVGVSSMQLDDPERGFSFRHEGPLDMRMSRHGPTAADVVNTFDAGELARIFRTLGEERHAGRVARMIERRRAERPFENTLDLARAVETVVGRNPKEKIHPATRVFQALRIFVNDELRELARALYAAERVLKPGGRLVVITFHSLEDRIVKRFMALGAGAGGGSRHMPEETAPAATFEKPDRIVTPSREEAERNPRARSAKLRVATRTAAPPREQDFGAIGVPAIAVTGMRRRQ